MKSKILFLCVACSITFNCFSMYHADLESSGWYISAYIEECNKASMRICRDIYSGKNFSKNDLAQYADFARKQINRLSSITPSTHTEAVKIEESLCNLCRNSFSMLTKKEFNEQMEIFKKAAIAFSSNYENGIKEHKTTLKQQNSTNKEHVESLTPHSNK